MAVCLLVPVAMLGQSGDETPSHQEVREAAHGAGSSPYIPVDSWIYPAAIRLYELGYLPTAYLGMRPWTRASLAHMLRLSDRAVRDGDVASEEVEIYDRLRRELAPELAGDQPPSGKVESVYTRVRGVAGPVLTDSFHVGETIHNDYGRPYEPGFNNVSGASGYATAGRFSLYARAEFQHAPSAAGYTQAQAIGLAALDVPSLVAPPPPQIPLTGIPVGRIATANQARVLEANVSAHLLGHEVSFGKSDAWLGPGQGGSMAWSNNAENPYTFRINRIEPLWIPGLSRLTGLFRYDFFVGSLKGHSYPNDPWIHAEKISFKPTPDLEFGFERSVIWGGEGHVPITVHTFLRSFFSATAVDVATKESRNDPGARFSTFDFTWRVPWQNHLVTLYTDSLAHDNVFPVSNPGRIGLRPGVYLARLPVLRRTDLRVEATETDPKDPEAVRGQLLYWETVAKEGYTNRGQIIGDWIGRQSKGGQAWLTYHLHADQQVALEFRTAKASAAFIPGGTTQQALLLHATLRPARDLEVKATAQGEWWRVPYLRPGTQTDFTGTVQVTWYPHTGTRLP